MRAAARSPPASFACRAPGGRAARPWPRRRTSRCPIRRRPSSTRRRWPSRTSPSRPTSRAAGRPRRLLLLARRRARRPGARYDRLAARLARRPRRPEHAGDLAERQPLGHALPDGAGRRAPSRSEDAVLVGARDLDPPELAFIERARLATARRRRLGARRRRTRSTSPSTSTCSPPSRSSRTCPSRAAHRRRGGGAAGAGRGREAARGCRHHGLAPAGATPACCGACCAALGL